MEPVEFFRCQKNLLEDLFPESWFLKTKKKRHPAYIRWDLCRRMINQNGIIKFPEQKDELAEIGRIVLDSYVISLITRGDVQRLSWGSLSLYGDKLVQTKIRSRITDPEQFEDIMVELYTGAWHISKRHTVTPIENKRLPDFKVEFSNITYPIYIECKHLRTRNIKRIGAIIRKANSQLKRIADPCYGILLIDATLPIAAGQVMNNGIPAQAQEIINAICQSLSGKKNRSIGLVLLVWDDHMILGQPPERMRVALRRRSMRIHHKNPNIIVPKDLPLFEGFTVTYGISWSPRQFNER